MVNPIVVGASASCCVVIIEVATEMLPSAVIAPLQAAILAVEAAVFLVIPTAFLVAALRRRLARSAVADLVINMSRSGTGETVRTALREALCDSELDVLYWVPDVNAYVDPNGTVLADGQVSNAQLGRKQWPLSVESSDGKPLAAVVLDESLKNHPDLVDAAVAAAQLALERAQLQASNRVQIEEVRASRTRLIEAGVAERRRLERDLHDGAQQRLLALNLTLAAARVGAVDPEQVRFIDGIRSELHSTLTELRELAHGIHPALLAQAGLGPAVISVAERLPIDVSVDIPHLKMPPAVEATAYYLVCEAMVNATKHAAAGHVFVQAHRLGPDLMVEISDDGSGGARLSAGTGLAGLQDRVVALGGSFTIASPSDKGTRILARIPCG
jgi:signal transduction histidine kinase